jgi:hypothetical protein
MSKKIIKLSENTLKKIISESVKKVLKEGALSETADSSEYYQILDYLHDIRWTEEGERFLNCLYDGGFSGEEAAIEELRSIFPSANQKSIEAAINIFRKELGDTDVDVDEYGEFVPEYLRSNMNESFNPFYGEVTYQDIKNEAGKIMYELRRQILNAENGVKELSYYANKSKDPKVQRMMLGLTQCVNGISSTFSNFSSKLPMANYPENR